MPIYEYACTACGERTEAKQGFDDPPLDTCDRCGGKLRKLYSPVGVVFKGSGFYSTDARDAGKPPTSKEATKEKSGGKTAKKDTSGEKSPAPASKESSTS